MTLLKNIFASLAPLIKLSPAKETSTYDNLLFIAASLLIGSAFNLCNDFWSAILGLLFIMLANYLLFTHRTRLISWWLMGSVAWGIACCWMPKIIMRFSGYNLIASTFLSSILWLSAGLQFLLFALLFRWLSKLSNRLAIFYPAGCWVFLEVWMPQFLPFRLGNLFVGVPYLSNLGSLLGASAISFVVLIFTALFVQLLLRAKVSKKIFVPTLLLFLLCLVYCILREKRLYQEINNAKKLAVAVVQANLNQKEDFIKEKVFLNIERHRKISIEALKKYPVDLIIWPESAVGIDFSASENRFLVNNHQNPLPKLDIPLLFGGQTLVIPDNNLPTYHISAFLLSSGDVLGGRYDKKRLIPFAEKIPLEDQLPFLANLRQRNYALLAGKTIQNELTFLSPIDGGKQSYTLGVSICYEELWEDAYISISKSPPSILVSLSNDGWFDDSAAAKQHLFLARFRALEAGRYLIRSTNSGITSVIDPFARIQSSVPVEKPAVLIDPHIAIIQESTIFTALNNLTSLILTLPFAYLVLAAMIISTQRSVGV